MQNTARVPEPVRMDDNCDCRRNRGESSQRVTDDRFPAKVRPHLVSAAHPLARSRGDHDQADAGCHVFPLPFGCAKIIRPATVWSTRVTVTGISFWRYGLPFSTTIMVPSSRYASPWLYSLPS